MEYDDIKHNVKNPIKYENKYTDKYTDNAKVKSEKIEENKKRSKKIDKRKFRSKSVNLNKDLRNTNYLTLLIDSIEMVNANMNIIRNLENVSGYQESSTFLENIVLESLMNSKNELNVINYDSFNKGENNNSKLSPTKVNKDVNIKLNRHDSLITNNHSLLLNKSKISSNLANPNKSKYSMIQKQEEGYNYLLFSKNEKESNIQIKDNNMELVIDKRDKFSISRKKYSFDDNYSNKNDPQLISNVPDYLNSQNKLDQLKRISSVSSSSFDNKKEKNVSINFNEFNENNSYNNNEPNNKDNDNMKYLFILNNKMNICELYIIKHENEKQFELEKLESNTYREFKQKIKRNYYKNYKKVSSSSIIIIDNKIIDDYFANKIILKKDNKNFHFFRINSLNLENNELLTCFYDCSKINNTNDCYDNKYTLETITEKIKIKFIKWLFMNVHNNYIYNTIGLLIRNPLSNILLLIYENDLYDNNNIVSHDDISKQSYKSNLKYPYFLLSNHFELIEKTYSNLYFIKKKFPNLYIYKNESSKLNSKFTDNSNGKILNIINEIKCNSNGCLNVILSKDKNDSMLKTLNMLLTNTQGNSCSLFEKNITLSITHYFLKILQFIEIPFLLNIINKKGKIEISFTGLSWSSINNNLSINSKYSTCSLQTNSKYFLKMEEILNNEKLLKINDNNHNTNEERILFENNSLISNDNDHIYNKFVKQKNYNIFNSLNEKIRFNSSILNECFSSEDESRKFLLKIVSIKQRFKEHLYFEVLSSEFIKSNYNLIENIFNFVFFIKCNENRIKNLKQQKLYLLSSENDYKKMFSEIFYLMLYVFILQNFEKSSICSALFYDDKTVPDNIVLLNYANLTSIMLINSLETILNNHLFRISSNSINKQSQNLKKDLDTNLKFSFLMIPISSYLCNSIPDENDYCKLFTDYCNKPDLLCDELIRMLNNLFLFNKKADLGMHERSVKLNISTVTGRKVSDYNLSITDKDKILNVADSLQLFSEIENKLKFNNFITQHYNSDNLDSPTLGILFKNVEKIITRNVIQIFSNISYISIINLCLINKNSEKITISNDFENIEYIEYLQYQSILEKKYCVLELGKFILNSKESVINDNRIIVISIKDFYFNFYSIYLQYFGNISHKKYKVNEKLRLFTYNLLEQLLIKLKQYCNDIHTFFFNIILPTNIDFEANTDEIENVDDSFLIISIDLAYYLISLKSTLIINKIATVQNLLKRRYSSSRKQFLEVKKKIIFIQIHYKAHFLLNNNFDKQITSPINKMKNSKLSNKISRLTNLLSYLRLFHSLFRQKSEKNEIYFLKIKDIINYDNNRCNESLSNKNFIEGNFFYTSRNKSLVHNYRNNFNSKDISSIKLNKSSTLKFFSITGFNTNIGGNFKGNIPKVKNLKTQKLINLKKSDFSKLNFKSPLITDKYEIQPNDIKKNKIDGKESTQFKLPNNLKYKDINLENLDVNIDSKKEFTPKLNDLKNNKNYNNSIQSSFFSRSSSNLLNKLKSNTKIKTISRHDNGQFNEIKVNNLNINFKSNKESSNIKINKSKSSYPFGLNIQKPFLTKSKKISYLFSKSYKNNLKRLENTNFDFNNEIEKMHISDKMKKNTTKLPISANKKSKFDTIIDSKVNLIKHQENDQIITIDNKTTINSKTYRILCDNTVVETNRKIKNKNNKKHDVKSASSSLQKSPEIFNSNFIKNKEKKNQFEKMKNYFLEVSPENQIYKEKNKNFVNEENKINNQNLNKPIIETNFDECVKLKAINEEKNKMSHKIIENSLRFKNKNNSKFNGIDLKSKENCLSKDKFDEEDKYDDKAKIKSDDNFNKKLENMLNKASFFDVKKDYFSNKKSHLDYMSNKLKEKDLIILDSKNNTKNVIIDNDNNKECFKTTIKSEYKKIIKNTNPYKFKNLKEKLNNLNNLNNPSYKNSNKDNVSISNTSVTKMKHQMTHKSKFNSKNENFWESNYDLDLIKKKNLNKN